MGFVTQLELATFLHFVYILAPQTKIPNNFGPSSTRLHKYSILNDSSILSTTATHLYGGSYASTLYRHLVNSPATPVFLGQPGMVDGIHVVET